VGFQARLCAEQQRDMVWRTLRAMPLRLLERVLPWLAGARCRPLLHVTYCGFKDSGVQSNP
jgi:hypothetical protein